MTVFNFIKFQKTLKIETDDIIDCIIKLKDNMIIQGGNKGIKRYLINKFRVLSHLSSIFKVKWFNKRGS